MTNVDDLIIPTNDEIEQLDNEVLAEIHERLCKYIFKEACECTDEIAHYAFARLTTYRAGRPFGEALRELEVIAVLPRPTASQQWMINHPKGEPCPSDLHAAKAWRRQRGISDDDVLWEKYEAVMAEKRSREATASDA
jgi:hypothetical protein